MVEEYVGYTLRRLLAEREMTQADLAYACHMDRMNVSIFCTGKRQMPRLNTAHEFCRVLGLTLDSLWSECEMDWRTEGYRKWLRLSDEKYRSGMYAEQGAGLESERRSYETACAGGILVAGEGVEPPTQGFSVSRKRMPSIEPLILLKNAA